MQDDQFYQLLERFRKVRDKDWQDLSHIRAKAPVQEAPPALTEPKARSTTKPASSRRRGDPLNLIVKQIGGKKAEIHTLSNVPVSELMELIEQNLNVPVAYQRVLHKGKVLKTDGSLEEYGIQEGATLMVQVRKDAEQVSAGASASAERKDVFWDHLRDSSAIDGAKFNEQQIKTLRETLQRRIAQMSLEELNQLCEYLNMQGASS
eukprot:Clim_evm18s199 gene=Clim_evmTU18s199